MDPPTTDEEVKPEKLDELKEADPLYPCDLFDTEIVRKIAEEFLPGLASACVDNTTGGLFKSPASVAVDMRREMVDYLTQRSETFVAESVVMEGGPDVEVPDNPYDIISDFVDDFGSSKRNFFSKVSGWVLSERREDRIDDFVQEMEINGFWLIQRREAVAQTLLKNVDFKNAYHCNMKFNSAEQLIEHVDNCSFRTIDCMNEGCNASFTAAHLDAHDSVCPFKIIPCEQKCSDSIMRREMDRHCITACPMKLVNCPFYAAGCQATVPKCSVEQHCLENLNDHLLYVLGVIHKEVPVEFFKPRLEELEKSSSPEKLAKARDVRSLTIMVKDIEAKLGPLEVNTEKLNQEHVVLPSNKEECLASPNEEVCTGSPCKKEEAMEATAVNKECKKSRTEKEVLEKCFDNEVCAESPLEKEGCTKSPTKEHNESPREKEDRHGLSRSK